MLLRVLFFLLLMTTVTVHDANALLTSAKVTIKVVGEDGLPVEGAKVGIGFNYNTGRGTKDRSVRGVTDNDGLFVGSESCNGNIGYNVTKVGYYKSLGHYDFKTLGPFGWEPKNPELTVVLRKIVNPVPMYARDTSKSRIEIPVVDKDVGFDLIKFDWVIPYGTGIHSDFVFHLIKQKLGFRRFEYHVSLKFSNKKDGVFSVREELQYGSDFKLPRIAPLSGYVDNNSISTFAGYKNS